MTVHYFEISYIRIFPPIGVARLGDSGFNLDTGKPDGEIQWFLPSDLPGTENMPDSLKGRFRDDHNRIKRQVSQFNPVLEYIQFQLSTRLSSQAVRFRVYAYNESGTNLGEITSGKDSPYELDWTVHVANHKASYYEFHGMFFLRIYLYLKPG